MSDTAMMPRDPDGRAPASPRVVDQELADRLLAGAQVGLS
jgi:hypothetical protein